MHKLHEEIATYIEKHPKVEIFPLRYEEKQVWIKRARKTGSNIFHKLVYKLSKNPLLTPVEEKSSSEALHFESSKLHTLYASNISVPKVLNVSKDYFVIEDCGPTVHHLLKYKLSEEPQKLIVQTLHALATLHKAKQYHGGSQIKNFTFKDDTIYLIDFEESFNDSVTLEDLQFRDLFLFLFSVSKLKIEVNYAKLIEQYISLTGNDDIVAKFDILSTSVSWLMKILENKMVWKLVDRDTQSVYRLFKQLTPIKASS